MGDDGRAQSKEKKALVVRLVVVVGIPTWGWAAQFAASPCSGKCHRMEMAGGAVLAFPGHIQPGCV